VHSGAHGWSVFWDTCAEKCESSVGYFLILQTPWGYARDAESGIRLFDCWGDRGAFYHQNVVPSRLDSNCTIQNEQFESVYEGQKAPDVSTRRLPDPRDHAQVNCVPSDRGVAISHADLRLVEPVPGRCRTDEQRARPAPMARGLVTLRQTAGRS
jgi:hypothetical protein